MTDIWKEVHICRVIFKKPNTTFRIPNFKVQIFVENGSINRCDCVEEIRQFIKIDYQQTADT